VEVPTGALKFKLSAGSYSCLPVNRLTKLFDRNATPLTRSLRKSLKKIIRPFGKYWQGMLNSLKRPFGARRQTVKERRGRRTAYQGDCELSGSAVHVEEWDTGDRRHIDLRSVCLGYCGIF
jgi:hypothetical protein